MKAGALLIAACAGLLGAGTAPAADIVKGARLYGMHCASCHGASGVSVMPGAPNFARGERMLQPDVQILMAIRSGRNAMPAYNGIIPDRDILDVIAYMRTMRQ